MPHHRATTRPRVRHTPDLALRPCTSAYARASMARVAATTVRTPVARRRSSRSLLPPTRTLDLATLLARSGLRPVANALGCSWGATATVGMGSPPAWRRRSTIRYSSGASRSLTGCAPYIRSTILSDQKYIPKFIRPARTRAVIAPFAPPINCPAPTTSARPPLSRITVAICRACSTRPWLTRQL